MLRVLAIVFTLFGFTSSGFAQEVIKENECVYLQRNFTKSFADLWLCPDGTAYKYVKTFLSGNILEKAKPGETQCLFEEREKSWLCQTVNSFHKGDAAPKINFK